MLFGGGGALDGNVSMDGINDRHVTDMVIASYKDKCSLDWICLDLERVERMLLVDSNRFCKKVLVSLDPSLSPTKIHAKESRTGAQEIQIWVSIGILRT